MKRKSHFARFAFAVGCILLLQGDLRATAPGSPSPEAPLPAPPLKDIGFDQKLGETIPLDLVFADEAGKAVTLRPFFGKKPVILSLVYFDCPMLCGLTTDGLVRSLRALRLSAGTDFEVLSVSFDPRETPEIASAKKGPVMRQYARAGGADGWHFLTGSKESIDALTKSVGFRYVWDAEQKQFAHATGILVLTPEGRIARYFFGIEYPAKDLRLGLVEASEDRIGSVVDQLLLLCYHYDPKVGRYTTTVQNLVRGGALFTVGALAALVLTLLRREKRGTGAA
ncbi:MAG TPA: SCO family protein [Thermoanaerobaculia bacterium]|nr:SCO family protein [Thermoanaerobaculia bacterium]